jgi:hypothetical protein
MFEWRLDPDTNEEEASRIVMAVQHDGGEAQLRPRPTGVLPLLAIPIVIFGFVELVALTEQVVDWWTKRKRCGIMIHVGQDGKVDVRAISIPYGNVLFVGADGKTFQYVNVSGDQLKNLLDAASRGTTVSGGNPVSSHAAG